MKRVARVLHCAVLLACMPAAAAIAGQAMYESKPVTVTATIEAIDKAERMVTLKMSDGRTEQVKAPDEMEGFNRLKVGDQVSATYLEALVVRLAKPGDPAPSGAPTTITTRKDRTPGSQTRRDRTLRVTIEAIDAAAPSLRVKGPVATAVLKVSDAKQLQGLKVGDTVDVVYYESLLITVAHPAKKD